MVSNTPKQFTGNPRGVPVQSPPRTMTVQANGDVVVYDFAGNQIPGDRYVTVPLSAHLVLAVMQGDLLEQETIPLQQPAAQRQQRNEQRQTVFRHDA